MIFYRMKRCHHQIGLLFRYLPGGWGGYTLDQLLNKVLAVFLKNHWLKIRVFCIKFPLKIIKQLVYCYAWGNVSLHDKIFNKQTCYCLR